MAHARLPGPQSNLSHVIVSQDWSTKLEEPTEMETTLLGELDDDVRTPLSRLGCEIRLNKGLEGLVVYVPDPPPSEIP